MATQNNRPARSALLAALAADLGPAADGSVGSNVPAPRPPNRAPLSPPPAADVPIPPVWSALGDRIRCLLSTEPATDMLDAHGMDQWNASGCGVLAAALAPLMAQRGVEGARPYAVIVPSGVGGPARVAAHVVGNSSTGPFFDVDGWHSAEALRARYGRGSRLMAREAAVGPIAGPTGVACPQGAVRDLQRFLGRYLDMPFVVLHSRPQRMRSDYAMASVPPQLWTWDDTTTAARLYLVNVDGSAMPVNEHGTRLPPHYAQVARLARQDPRRQSCLVLGAPLAARSGPSLGRRHPTL